MSAAVAGMPPVYSFHGSEEKMGERRDGFFVEEEEEEEEEEALSESSSVGAASAAESSIGENSSSEAGGKDAEEEEVQSKAKGEDEDEQGLGTLESLEDSLPIKRGLSNFYAGKSKSFTSLAEAASAAAVKELAKPENPFNKRRRVLAAWSRRASCSSLVTTFLPALLAPDHAVAEGEEGEEESDDDDDEDLPHNTTKNAAPALPPPRLNVTARNRTFRSPRSFSLSDLRNTGYN